MFACFVRRPTDLRNSIQAGHTVNAQDKSNKRTALHAAAYIGNVECCQVLVEAGASINVKVLPLRVQHLFERGAKSHNISNQRKAYHNNIFTRVFDLHVFNRVTVTSDITMAEHTTHDNNVVPRAGCHVGHPFAPCVP